MGDLFAVPKTARWLIRRQDLANVKVLIVLTVRISTISATLRLDPSSVPSIRAEPLVLLENRTYTAGGDAERERSADCDLNGHPR